MIRDPAFLVPGLLALCAIAIAAVASGTALALGCALALPALIAAGLVTAGTWGRDVRGALGGVLVALLLRAFGLGLAALAIVLLVDAADRGIAFAGTACTLVLGLLVEAFLRSRPSTEDPVRG